MVKKMQYFEIVFVNIINHYQAFMHKGQPII
jgi:hypothetical protein